MRRDFARWSFLAWLVAFALLSYPAAHISALVVFYIFVAPPSPMPFVSQLFGVILLLLSFTATISGLWLLARKFLRQRQAWSFGLFTALVATVVASLILLANVHKRASGQYGFPAGVEILDGFVPVPSIISIAFNIEAGIFLVFLAIAACKTSESDADTELPPTSVSSFTIAGMDPWTFVAPPPGEGTLRSPLLKTTERLLYAIPMFTLFAFICCSHTVMVTASSLFEEWGLYSSGITDAAVRLKDWVEQFPWALLLFALLILWLYFDWIVRDRRRVLIFNLIILILLPVGLFGLALAVLMPFFILDHPCIVAGEKVRTPDGEKAIESLRVGDDVIAVAANGHVQVSKITAVSKQSVDRWLSIFLSSGIELRITDNHPVAAGDDWISAGELRVGAALHTMDGATSVVRIVHCNAPTEVFDISVSPNSNFFASGVLVHNKIGK